MAGGEGFDDEGDMVHWDRVPEFEYDLAELGSSDLTGELRPPKQLPPRGFSHFSGSLL